MADTNDILANVSNYIAAAAALGTAAFALVDGLKTLPSGGPSNLGFKYIRGVVTRFLPRGAQALNSMSTEDVLGTLHGNWINGTALPDQKAIAKSLIKLRLTAATAEDMAKAAGVNKDLLASAMTKQAASKPMTQPEQDVFGRFDLILTATLDAGYQRADQTYRNGSRVLAIFAAVVLALVGGYLSFDYAAKAAAAAQGGDALKSVDTAVATYIFSSWFWKAGLVGLVATPIAPIAKDLTSGLAASIKLAQAWTR